MEQRNFWEVLNGILILCLFRVETHPPPELEMESGMKETRPNWLLMGFHPEVRSMLSSEWDQRRFLACMDKYLHYAKEESTEVKKVTNLIKILSGSMYLFRDLNENFKTTPAYLSRITQLLQLYLDAELRSSVQGITYHMEIVNKISLQIDFHLKGQDPSYILSVFLSCPRAQNKAHRLIMDSLYKKYITVPSWTVSKVELPDKLMLMYIIAYKQWLDLFLEDRLKFSDVMKNFAMFKPRESFLTNPKIPEALREIYSHKRECLENFEESENELDEISTAHEALTRNMTLPMGDAGSKSMEDNQLDFSLLEVGSEGSVPIPLVSNRLPNIVKKEAPLMLGMIDLTLDDVNPRMEWLQHLARKARDAQEVRVSRYSSMGDETDVICLSDSEESEVDERTGNEREREDDQVRSEEVMLTENSLASSVMAKNREKLDSITSNLDVGLTMKHVEKSGLSHGTKSAIKFGVRDDLVGSTPRKAPETLGENQTMCATEENSLGAGVEDSQNSVDNYPIFNEIRMEEREMEAQPAQHFYDHPNYFCDEFLQRRRQSSEGQQQENVIFSMPQLTKRPLPSEEPLAAGSSERIHFTTTRSTTLPMVVRDIITDFSDAEDADEDEVEIESPSMETIERADLVEFMEQISEGERHTCKTPTESIKPILDRSSSAEKSAKIKKKVKFGAAQVVEMDDLPREKIYRNYLERSSPRKAILKSSLKRSLHASFSEDYGKFRTNETNGREWKKSPSNIMVKRTYVSPSPVNISHHQMKAELKASPPEAAGKRLADESTSQQTSPQRSTSKQNQLSIRREFENRKKKMKRRNSIACITYSDRKLSRFEKRLESPAASPVVARASLPEDQKLYRAYVPLVKIVWPVIRDKSPGENHVVPDKAISKEPEKKIEKEGRKVEKKVEKKGENKIEKDEKKLEERIEMKEEEKKIQKKIERKEEKKEQKKIEKKEEAKIEKKDEDTKIAKKIEQKFKLKTEASIADKLDTSLGPLTRSKRRKSHGVNRSSGNTSSPKMEKKEPQMRRRRKLIVESVAEEIPDKIVPPLVVLNPIPKNLVVIQDDENVPSRLSDDLLLAEEVPPKKKRKNNKINKEIVKNERKVEQLNVSQEDVEMTKPEAQSTPLRGQEKVEQCKIDEIPPKEETKTSLPVISSDECKLSSSLEVKIQPKVRQDLTVITKKTMKLIHRDTKLSRRACLDIRRLTTRDVQEITDHIAKWMMGIGSHPGRECAEKGLAAQQGATTEASTSNSSKDCDTKRDSEQGGGGEENPDAIKRGRRSEGKRNKTPRRLKRSQIYQKILEDSGVMEQIEVKPLSVLSLNEEIGKMASPDSTSSHGEANRSTESQFQGKPPSPEYVNSTISSTVNTEISSTTQIAGPSGGNSDNSVESKREEGAERADSGSLERLQEAEEAPIARTKKEEVKVAKVEFNGPILRSTGSVSTPPPPSAPPKTSQECSRSEEGEAPGNEDQKEFVSCDSQGDLGEPEKSEENQGKTTENPEESPGEDKIPEEESEEAQENTEVQSEDAELKDSEEKGCESPQGCDSQGQMEAVEVEVEEFSHTNEIMADECQDASQEAQPGSPQEEQESANEEEMNEKEPEEEAAMKDAEEEEEDDDDTSIDFEDFDTVSEYSDPDSALDGNEADSKAADEEEGTHVGNSADLDKSIDAAMMNFDPSEAFKDTSDVESQHGDAQEMQVKDNLFENISSIESTEQNYLQCAKNPSPDSSNTENTATTPHCADENVAIGMNCGDAIPDTSDVGNNELSMDEQRTYVEHDGLFSSPIYDHEPDVRGKFNGQMTDQLMYTHTHANNILLEADSSENISRNLAIDDLVEEMPSDETTLITESDIFEEYCENLTSIGDNVTVETESEIVTEAFGNEGGATDDFATVFRTTLPHDIQTSLPTSTYIATTLAVPEVMATRKSDRQRIKSHTNLYVEHDYSPRTDTNRITPISSTSRTGDRYLLPPKAERMNRKRSFPGDGRDRKKQRKPFGTMPESTISPLPTQPAQLPTIANPNPQMPLPVVPQPPPQRSIGEQQSRGKVSISAVSPYLEVHNTLQQQIGRQKCVPLLPSPPVNGDTATIRKFRRPNRMENTPPHHSLPPPVYEQISPCPPEKLRTTCAEVKTFNMIPSTQSIAALASVAHQKQSARPGEVPPLATGKKDIATTQVFSQTIGEYQILQYTAPNPTDYCIITTARQPQQVPPLPAVQATFPNSAVGGSQQQTTGGKVFLTAPSQQPEELPQFVVGESDDLVANCLSGSTK
uniref:Putative transcriptional regulator icp22 n=1 Tax=Lutzomyia longipalpis TaxID=7200 RepID=A0A1B0CTG5_LUTLO